MCDREEEEEEEEEEAGGRGTRDTESKTRTPHKDVGKNKVAAVLTTLGNFAHFERSLRDSLLRFAMYLKGRNGTCVQNVPLLPWVWTSFSHPIGSATAKTNVDHPMISVTSSA